ncbi:bacterioferritin-associated ferredoxin [Methylobacterium sp. A49B]|uniref:(2Fe-2S)-binding protein n=1 Tax=Methylobacterium mesophilicum SR1.6/6 TaxID=908290 RepID=A0A6B9FW05_9HYPH|nr:(2Fe-2S)-binding protein [Methylobacterium mesophilicum]QGY06062.1 (2Fe-2S)-binding protein [Methylobacterium mesophilicum SR1.6/6]
MIVCSCNVISDGAVRGCLAPGPGCPRTPAQVYACLGCSPKCGRCARTIRSIMQSALGSVAGPLPAVEGSHACTTACASACSLVKFQTADEGVAA